MEFNTELKSDEILLIGSWKMDDGKIIADEVCERIEKLVANYLEKVAVDKTGWEILYKDTTDNRYWLLTYPNSDWQGGGPPILKMLTQKEVTEKFELLN
ncbi:Imm27 family immunity protein [Flavobacterium columnare]|uniref:Imm27 family immunity protein n=1 Tax=Flavobacterium columnare TaxID=996 RepID=UPI0013D06D01|nr:Imm27 family immunity protein [Flavobacterium columnare]